MFTEINYFFYLIILIAISCDNRKVNELQRSNNSEKSAIEHKCEAWNLTDEKINYFMQHSKPISGHEWHYIYYTLPCEISTTITRNDSIFRIDINAGGWAFLFFNDDFYERRGCVGVCCEELFLIMPESH